MATVFDLLAAIRERPSMYVGEDDASRGNQLRNLELLLHGYALAVRLHGLDEPVKNLPHEFAEYLRAKHDWSAAAGPVAAIREASGSDEEAWEVFWTLLDEYRGSLGH